MKRVFSSLAVLALCAPTAVLRSQERELVATIRAPEIGSGIVSELAWDGGTLLIQTVAVQRDGSLRARYLMAAGAGMKLRPLADPPPGMERYWQMKASRVSPTGLGRITAREDAKLPMYGIGSLEQRMQQAVEMGGTLAVHEVHLHALMLHRRADVAPYDGEVWSWSPAELNRIAYVDEKGDLWIAAADGTRAERLLRGRYTLPAWSLDGRLIAVVERRDDGRRWDVSIVHVPERHRR